ncbi:MAG: hypothetical protein AAGI52_07565 [Bacteroidota bacterium]
MRLSFFVLLLACASASAQPVGVPGTRVSLDPPKGYVASERFAGFEHDALQGSLMVLELPEAPLAEVLAEFSSEALAQQGIRDAAMEEIEINGVTSALVTGQQTAYGETFDKWILVTGDSLGVVMVNGALPVGTPEPQAKALRLALQSVTLGAPSNDLFDGLPFTLDVPDAFPERNRIGASLLLSLTYGEANPGAPLYIAALGAAPLIGDLDTSLTVRMRQTATLTDFGPITTRTVSLDGREAIEGTAEARDADTGIPVTVVSVLAPYTETGYLILHAMVGSDRAEEWLPQFRALTESLTWKP